VRQMRDGETKTDAFCDIMVVESHY
jgi:hypothetical protein